MLYVVYFRLFIVILEWAADPERAAPVTNNVLKTAMSNVEAEIFAQHHSMPSPGVLADHILLNDTEVGIFTI